MAKRQSADQYYQGNVYRIVWGVSGLLLAALGIFVVFFGVVGLPIRIGAGSLMTVLGANAVWSSMQSRESWLAKFVPFL